MSADSNAVATITDDLVSNYTKKLGGVTGKGFMPGKSGNPGGRKKKFITTAYEAIAENPQEALKIARAIIDRAQTGDVSAAKEVTDRLEGSIRDSHDDAPASLQINIQVVG